MLNGFRACFGGDDQLLEIEKEDKELNGPNVADVSELVELLENSTSVDEEDCDSFTEFGVWRCLSVTRTFCLVYLITSLFFYIFIFYVFVI